MKPPLGRAASSARHRQAHAERGAPSDTHMHDMRGKMDGICALVHLSVCPQKPPAGACHPG
jgi:hypothetical protein